MGKKIVLFSDGTGNSSANPNKTNVWRAYKALVTSPDSRQVVVYDNGVGTSSFTPKAILGLALGVGLARNVRELYTFLCRTYEDGDSIYAFGFSRGAFTIRVLVALICSQGIIDQTVAANKRDLNRLVRAAYRQYRRENFTPSFLSFFLAPLIELLSALKARITRVKRYDKSRNIRATDSVGDLALIRFVGVWDTVDAYGLPVDELTRAWDKVIWPLNAKDRDLSPRVAQACHALALDEQRLSFEPMLWNERGGKEQRIKQIWFPGVHADVGGGYPDDALALVSLNWMCEEAREAGLEFHEDDLRHYREKANALGKIHDSRSGVGAIYRYAPRDVAYLCHERRPGLWGFLKSIFVADYVANAVDIKRAKVHHSVFDRIRNSGQAYAPINLPEEYSVVEPGVPSNYRPEGPSTRVLETFDEASERYVNQAAVWIGVWLRKVVYAATLLALIAFVTLPWTGTGFAESIEMTLRASVDPILGTFGSALNELPELIGRIPGLGFVGDWAIAYRDYPLVFGGGILILALLTILSLRLESMMQSRMLYNWRHISGVEYRSEPDPGPFQARIAALLSGLRSPRRVVRPVGVVLEFLAMVVLFLLLFVGASRLVYSAVDGAGRVCAPPKSGNSESGLSKAFLFDPSSLCFDTGVDLEYGEEYAVHVMLRGWSDQGIPADAGGWTDAPLAMYLWTPLRRHLFADWYQPIARIQNTLFDRYPLASTYAVDAGEQDRGDELRLLFKARRSGRLYLYMNDAVIFTPAFADQFDVYDNNCGCAQVSIRKIDNSRVDMEEFFDTTSVFSCKRELAKACFHHPDFTPRHTDD